MCIFFSWYAKCNSNWLLESDSDHAKKASLKTKTKEKLKSSLQYGCAVIR